jgi:hypothetical protein
MEAPPRHPPRHIPDSFGVADGAAAVFLDDQAHVASLQTAADRRWSSENT